MVQKDFSVNVLFPIKGDEENTEDKLGLMINEHSFYPLYIYPSMNNKQQSAQSTERTPNLNLEIVNEIAKGLGLDFVPEKETGNLCFVNNNDELRDEFKQTFAPIDLLDYIYALLHSPSYFDKYNEFQIIDAPRVPYPKDADKFWQLVKLGSQIRGTL